MTVKRRALIGKRLTTLIRLCRQAVLNLWFSIESPEPTPAQNTGLKQQSVIGLNMTALFSDSASPNASPSPSPSQKYSWLPHALLHVSLRRVAAYTMAAALLVTAISVYGDAIPSRLFQLSQLPQVSQRLQVGQLMSGPPRSANVQGALASDANESFLTHEEFLSAKAKIWKNFREQVRQCGRGAPVVQGGD